MLCIICNSHVYQALLSRGYFIFPWLYRFEALSWRDYHRGRRSARATITFAWRRGGAGNGGGGTMDSACVGGGERYIWSHAPDIPLPQIPKLVKHLPQTFHTPPPADHRTRYTLCKICQVRGTHPIKFHAPYAHDIYFGAFVEHTPLSFHELVAPSISNMSPKAPWLVRTTAPPPKQKGRSKRPMLIPRPSSSSALVKAQGLPVASPQFSQVQRCALQVRLPPQRPSPAHTPR